MPRIDAFLKLGIAQGCSDVHLAVGVPPMLRMSGDLVPIRFRELGGPELESYIMEILNRGHQDRFRGGEDIDFSYVSEDGGRFRVNVFRKDSGVGAVFRTIPAEIPTIESLGLPPIVPALCDYHQGMVLVTGSTGTGKSTTLAAMIDIINRSKYCNIITIEDPIEFLHPNKQSIVNQREVGLDTKSYGRALRSAMRAAPDVIQIGEIRDRESMQSAIDMAGTGHLVLATLHANNSPETLDRIINMFPQEQHAQVFMDLAHYLRAIISQRLVRARNGKRVAAVELMLNTPHIRDLILRGDISSVKEALQQSGERGVQNFDDALLNLYKTGTITLEEAMLHADSRANLEAKVNYGG